MSRSRLRLALAAGAAVTVAAATAASAAPSPASAARTIGLVRGAHAGFAMTQSNNWSGYNQGTLEKGGTQFHSISGEWVVPTATAHQKGEDEYSSSWVGIGGGCVDAGCTVTDSTLIQAGTEQDVAADGSASYSTWYELIPAPSVTTPLAVSPGNTVRVDIDETVPGLWTITITNLSTGKNWTTTTPYSSTYATAEWIEETPVVAGTSGVQVGPLPNLGTVKFGAASVNGQPAGLVSSEAMQLVDLNGNVLATPSAPDAAAVDFNDCTYATSCAAPSGSPSGTTTTTHGSKRHVKTKTARTRR